MVIGYHKYKNHIIIIETDLDNDPYNNKFIVQMVNYSRQ